MQVVHQLEGSMWPFGALIARSQRKDTAAMAGSTTTSSAYACLRGSSRRGGEEYGPDRCAWPCSSFVLTHFLPPRLKTPKAHRQLTPNSPIHHQDLAGTTAPFSWNAVVEYAFLAGFDPCRTLSRHSGVATSKPACRALMDGFFKTERAQEEIRHLNIQIPRAIVYVWDEDKYLRKCKAPGLGGSKFPAQL